MNNRYKSVTAKELMELLKDSYEPFTAKRMMRLLKCPFYAEVEADVFGAAIFIKTPARYVGYIAGLQYRYVPIGIALIIEEDNTVKGKTIRLARGKENENNRD